MKKGMRTLLEAKIKNRKEMIDWNKGMIKRFENNLLEDMDTTHGENSIINLKKENTRLETEIKEIENKLETIQVKYLGHGEFEVNKVLVTYSDGKVFNTGKLKAGQFRKCYNFIQDYMVNNHHNKEYDIELIKTQR